MAMAMRRTHSNDGNVVDFKSVGGMREQIECLREMVLSSSANRQLLRGLGVQPSCGVLLHGPTGVGKTLLVRALAAECAACTERRVLVFTRKGADCLSKWVGESERNLRTVFEKARQNNPAVIFFDEIDSLAPTRVAREEMVHSTLASTLLALMDDLHTDGADVVVIGATNRLDAVDPALRRPGRFDKELHCRLPTAGERREILAVHTRSWRPAPMPQLLTELARVTCGYSGADLQAVCTQAAEAALRRRGLTQQMESRCLSIEEQDFRCALDAVAPRIQFWGPARPLPDRLWPLMQGPLNHALNLLEAGCPPGLVRPYTAPQQKAPSTLADVAPGTRLLLCGAPKRLAPALLHSLEHLPAIQLGSGILEKVKRATPCVLYAPDVGNWWESSTLEERDEFENLAEEVPQCVLLATTGGCHSQLPEQLRRLFSQYRGQVLEVQDPTDGEREEYFRRLLLERAVEPPAFRLIRSKTVSNLVKLESSGTQRKRRNRRHKRKRLGGRRPSTPKPEPQMRGRGGVKPVQVKEEPVDSENWAVVVSRRKLEELVRRAVMVTEGAPLCELEQLHAALQLVVARYSASSDRSMMHVELEERLALFEDSRAPTATTWEPLASCSWQG